jgi:hypothetical protein
MMIKLGKQTFWGDDSPGWSDDPSELDFLILAMCKSENVYTFGSWNNLRMILSNQANVDWLLKDLKITWVQLQVQRGRWSYERDMNRARNEAAFAEMEHDRECPPLRNVPQVDPDNLQWQMMFGCSREVVDLNRMTIAMSIPHAAVLVNGAQGTYNAYKGNYPELALNLVDIALARSPGIEVESGISAWRSARRADILMGSLSRTMVVGRYGDLARDFSTSGLMNHHLNQEAAFEGVIAYEDGLCVRMGGDAIHQPGTPHFEFHTAMEAFWNKFREGGELFVSTAEFPRGRPPTCALYGEAVLKALKAAGYSDQEATILSELARQDRIDHGLNDTSLVPRIPGPQLLYRMPFKNR